MKTHLKIIHAQMAEPDWGENLKGIAESIRAAKRIKYDRTIWHTRGEGKRTPLMAALLRMRGI